MFKHGASYLQGGDFRFHCYSIWLVNIARKTCRFWIIRAHWICTLNFILLIIIPHIGWYVHILYQVLVFLR